MGGAGNGWSGEWELMKGTGLQKAAKPAWGEGIKSKNYEINLSNMSGSRNVVQETAVWLVDAAMAAEGVDTQQNGLWPKGD